MLGALKRQVHHIWGNMLYGKHLHAVESSRTNDDPHATGDGPHASDDCHGVASFGLDAVSRTPSKRLASIENASRPWTSSGGRRLPGRCGPDARPCRHGHPACGTPPSTRHHVVGPGSRYLKAGYSPERMAGTRAVVHPETPSLQGSHETSYTASSAMPRGALRTDVIGWLRFGHATRRPRARGEDRRGRIPDRVSMHDRPPDVEERLIPGHWEGDLIKGAQNRSAVGTLGERTTLFTVLSRMDHASAEAALSGFSPVLNRIEARVCR